MAAGNGSSGAGPVNTMNNHQGTAQDTDQEAGQRMDTNQPTNPWLLAARSIPTPTPTETTPVEPAHEEAPAESETPENRQQCPVLVAAHGGAGATVWSRILGGSDGGNVDSWAADRQTDTGPVVLVLRASMDGISAAKNVLADYGADTFTAALVVAAGPANPPRRLSDELRILAGAVPLAHTPWVPGLLLKRAVTTAPTDLPAKELSKLTTTLTNHGVYTEGETK